MGAGKLFVVHLRSLASAEEQATFTRPVTDELEPLRSLVCCLLRCSVWIAGARATP
jgi:hypothetical protein